MGALKNCVYAFFCVAVHLASCQDFYDGCSTTKGCQGFPADCVAGKSCAVAVSYVGIAEDKYKFEIVGKATGDLQVSMLKTFHFLR